MNAIVAVIIAVVVACIVYAIAIELTGERVIGLIGALLVLLAGFSFRGRLDGGPRA